MRVVALPGQTVVLLAVMDAVMPDDTVTVTLAVPVQLPFVTLTE